MNFSTELAIKRVAEALTALFTGEKEIVKGHDLDGNSTWRIQRHFEDQ